VSRCELAHLFCLGYFSIYYMMNLTAAQEKLFDEFLDEHGDSRVIDVNHHILKLFEKMVTVGTIEVPKKPSYDRRWPVKVVSWF
jgi:hypothetical protein